MLISAVTPKIIRWPTAFAALWLCWAGPAWAGSGGEDAGTLQAFLDAVCTAVGIGVPGGPNGTMCPPRYQYPTLATSPITELILQIAAFENAPPEMVRYTNNVSPTASLNALNPPAGSPTDQTQIVLSSLTPLAFLSPPTAHQQLAATQLGDRAANSFFYAGTNGVPQTPPDTLFLVYDYPARTGKVYAKGQDIADISLPLVVLNAKLSQTAVPTVLQIRGRASPCAGGPPCYTANAVGDFLGLGGGKSQTVPAAELGLNVKLVFGPSANSPTSHAILQVEAKIVLTGAPSPGTGIDPEYFFNPIASLALPAVFTTDLYGFTSFPSKDLPAGALGIGVAPGAMLGPPTVPGGPPTPPFTAAIANNFNGLLGTPPAAASAYLAIATDGETLVSTPVSP